MRAMHEERRAVGAPAALRLPPGPEGLPYFGNAFQFRRDPLTFVQGVQRSFGRLATVWMAGFPMVMFFRPEHVRYFLIEHPRGFTNSEVTAGLRRTLGKGLLTTDGEYHRRLRRLVQPAFSKKRVDGYADVMVRHTRDLLDGWQAGARLDIARAMQALTLRIVAQALFDVDLESERPGLSEAFQLVIENPPQIPWSLSAIHLDLPFLPYGKYLAGRRMLDGYVYDLIARRRAEGRDRGDVLSTLLAARDEDGVGLSDEEIRDQTMTLFAAGHETTANALAWTFYLLSEHPAEHARLSAELADVLGGRDPTPDDVVRLPYLDWVVTESMRLYPPAWTQGRHASEPFELEGYQFPAGTIAMFSQWVIHRLPDIWGDPDRFRPERWDPARGEQVPSGAYFPFGGGPRTCIGMPFAQLEARLLLATILQRFSPTLVPGYPVVPRPRVTLRPKYGIAMTLEPARVAARA
jgi:cytochrome P450